MAATHAVTSVVEQGRRRPRRRPTRGHDGIGTQVIRVERIEVSDSAQAISATSTHSITRSEVNSMTDEEWDEIFEQTFRKFVADGLIYDTGERGWCEQTKSYKILWAFAPPKSERH